MPPTYEMTVRALAEVGITPLWVNMVQVAVVVVFALVFMFVLDVRRILSAMQCQGEELGRLRREREERAAVEKARYEVLLAEIRRDRTPSHGVGPYRTHEGR